MSLILVTSLFSKASTLQGKFDADYCWDFKGQLTPPHDEYLKLVPIFLFWKALCKANICLQVPKRSVLETVHYTFNQLFIDSDTQEVITVS